MNDIKTYCCTEMENAVMKGTVKETDILAKGDMDFITRYIESIKAVRPVRKLFRGKTDEILTEDLMVRYCIFCGVKQ